MAASRPDADWERIEADYRAGVISIREIAKQHSLTDAAIRQRAKKEKWERDLTDKVQKAATTRLLRIATRLESDDQVIDRSAAVVVAVVRGHQKTLASLGTIAERLNDWMLRQTEIGDSELMPKVAESFSKCAQAAAKYIPLERQAFNIGAGEEKQSLAEFLKSLND